VKRIPVFVPDVALSTDNAAMIAAAGLRRFRRGDLDPYVGINAEASLGRYDVLNDLPVVQHGKAPGFIRITDDGGEDRREERRQGRMVLVSAMHITAGVYVNDWENGLIADFQVWLEKLARRASKYLHHTKRAGQRDAPPEADHHGTSGLLPITAGKLDLRSLEQVFYAEFRRAAP